MIRPVRWGERGERSHSTATPRGRKKQNNRACKSANKQVSFFNLSKCFLIATESVWDTADQTETLYTSSVSLEECTGGFASLGLALSTKE